MSEKTLKLIGSVRMGDVIAFEELSDVYAPLIKAQVAKYISGGKYRISESDRDDLYQEALLALYKAACSYESRDHVQFGLYAKICIHNGLATAAAKLNRQNFADSDADDEHSVFDDIEDPDASPEEQLIANERLSEIHRFIEEQFTDYERRVFSLHLAHRTYAEIAETVGKDVKSVATALVRVRDKLRNYSF